jgi:hypothetical protein
MENFDGRMEGFEGEMVSLNETMGGGFMEGWRVL